MLGGGKDTYFLPIQFLGPKEKGCSASLLSPENRSSPSHRSGMNAPGRVKFLGERNMAHCHMLTTVPSGSHRSQMTLPPAGTTRGVGPGAGG